MLSLLLLLGATISVSASPIVPLEQAEEMRLRRSTSVSPMTAAQESSYATAAMFASTAYCPASETITWSCGVNCQTLSGFQPHASGGDGTDTQYWYVGYDPTYTHSIVVAHQGTDPSSLIADLTDADFFLEPLSQSLFPGVPSGLEAHNGFLGTHSRSAPSVLAAVQSLLASTGSTKVLITGHSLGAAIALLDAVYLRLHLPASTVFTTSVFGLPRVGNPAFATYVDTYITNFAHVTNKLDIVPILPGRFLGFAHPSSEKHIVTTGLAPSDWYACVGQDNTSVDCSTGAVPNVFEGTTACYGAGTEMKPR